MSSWWLQAIHSFTPLLMHPSWANTGKRGLPVILYVERTRWRIQDFVRGGQTDNCAMIPFFSIPSLLFTLPRFHSISSHPFPLSFFLSLSLLLLSSRERVQIHFWEVLYTLQAVSWVELQPQRHFCYISSHGTLGSSLNAPVNYRPTQAYVVMTVYYLERLVPIMYGV